MLFNNVTDIVATLIVVKQYLKANVEILLVPVRLRNACNETDFPSRRVSQCVTRVTLREHRQCFVSVFPMQHTHC